MIQQPWPVRFVYKAPVVLLGAVGYLYALRLVLNYAEDTTRITTAAFAIMVSLAGVSFSFARVVESEDLRDRLMFAGERILHGAILVLVSSLLKYFLFVSVTSSSVASIQRFSPLAVGTVGVLAGLIFGNGVLFAHTCLRILNDLLLHRMTRQRDWDDMW
jgi:hypothetical protein